MTEPSPAIARLLDVATPPWLTSVASEAVPALGLYQPGKVGWADLRLRAFEGITRLVEADVRVPYQVGRLHQRPDLPGQQALLYLTMPTGGLVQGDRLAVRAVAERGVRVRLTTPAATKIYGMAANYAQQAIELGVEPGAWLEWWPEPTIPYRAARYHQVTRLAVAPEGVLWWAEILLPGRSASAECHAYRTLVLECAGYALTGEGMATEVPLWQDRLVLLPDTRSPLGVGRLAGRGVLATAYLLAPGRSLTALAEALAGVIAEQSTVLAGVSGLPGEMGLIVRLLGATTTAINDLLEQLHAIVVAMLSEKATTSALLSASGPSPWR